jgi:hypothetical protein
VSQDNTDISSGPIRLDNMQEDAKSRGLTVRLPGVSEILLDLDDAQSQYVMEALVPIARRVGIDVKIAKITRSQHGNKHAYLTVPFALTAVERLLLQAIFGSDRKRELLSYARVRKGVSPESALFEVPERKVKHK